VVEQSIYKILIVSLRHKQFRMSRHLRRMIERPSDCFDALDWLQIFDQL